MKPSRRQRDSVDYIRRVWTGELKWSPGVEALGAELEREIAKEAAAVIEREALRFTREELLQLPLIVRALMIGAIQVHTARAQGFRDAHAASLALFQSAASLGMAAVRAVQSNNLA